MDMPDPKKPNEKDEDDKENKLSRVNTFYMSPNPRGTMCPVHGRKAAVHEGTHSHIRTRLSTPKRPRVMRQVTAESSRRQPRAAEGS